MIFRTFQWSIVRLLTVGAFAISLFPTSSKLTQVQAADCVQCGTVSVGNQTFLSCQGGGHSLNCNTNNGICTVGGTCGGGGFEEVLDEY